MAQLNSPGVSVTVIDESFYTPAAPGTVPLIIVASAENKPNASGTGTAPGTLKVNSGQVYLLTSQKDLVDTFGTPTFYTDANNNPIHAGEQNEYGLQTAYSYLGVSNRAFIVRADLDLGQLTASADAPAGAPEDGTYWFDTSDTNYGIFEWNSAPATRSGGQKFKNKLPIEITDPTQVTGEDFSPRASIGAIGDYAIVSVTNLNTLWYKKGNTGPSADPAGTWVRVGSPEWKASRPVVQGTTVNPSIEIDDNLIFNIEGVSGSVTVTGVNSLTALVTAINDSSGPQAHGITAGNINGLLEIYSNEKSFSLTGTVLTKVGILATEYKPLALQISPHYSVPRFKRTGVNDPGNPTGSIWVKTTTPNLGAKWIVRRYNEATAAWDVKSAPLYESHAAALAAIDPTGGGRNLQLGTVYVKYNDFEQSPSIANFKLYVRRATGATSIKSAPITDSTFSAGPNSFTISESDNGSATYSAPVTITFYATSGLNSGFDNANKFLAALTAGLTNSNIVASKIDSTNQIIISHTLGGEIKFVDDGALSPIKKMFSTSSTVNFYADASGAPNSYVASLWTSTVGGKAFAEASPLEPTTEPADGILWYNSMVEDVDIMIHDGSNWRAYRNVDQGTAVGSGPTDAAGPIVAASRPLTQSTGDELAEGDLWVDTSDLENYPKIHRYDYQNKRWMEIDVTDQSTEEGIIFRDARWNTTGTTETPSTIEELLGGTGDGTLDDAADFLDPDAPDPHLYPRGMLLWNLRRSGFNVKKFVKNYIDILSVNQRMNDEEMSDYYPHRWLSWSPNKADGSGSFGRHAQRSVVVQALQALTNSNQEIRDEESKIFNLIACPGYPELINEMITLNFDRALTSFVVGDSPARLKPDATTMSNWGDNLAGALEDNDKGLVSYDEYMAVYYPWGYSSDNLGNNIAVPPSHMMLRTIALSDNVSYPWFAPAGTRRGGITNASAVGYITSEGEFQSVSLNTGQRDVMASIKVNPITFISGSGIICYGQRTRARNASALDRVNVARLVVYLRRQFTQLAKPYIFEPNDKITRDEIKGAAESLLLELVGQRALYDYVVVCDTSNNTPARIDRNELYLDVAIEPVKAVEFIYIPLRLKNTGTIKNIASQ